MQHSFMNIYCVINPHNFIIILYIAFTSSIGDLSVALNNSGIGGYLRDAFLNHLCYADDICLIACPPITLLGII